MKHKSIVRKEKQNTHAHTQKEPFGEHDNKIKSTRFDHNKSTRSSKTVDNYMDEFIIFS